MRVVLDLKVVVYRLVLERQIILPEREAVRRNAEAERADQYDGDAAGDGLFALEYEVRNADGGQHAGEDQERGRSADGGNGDKGRDKGSDDAADGVERVEPPDGLAGIVQIIYRELRQRRGNGAEQDAGEGEYEQACRERRPDEEILRDERRKQERYTGYHPAPDKWDESYPYRGDDDAAIQPVRRFALVRHAAAPHVADGHGDHYNADYDRPHDLGRAEIGSHKPAGSKLDRHHGHTGEKLRQIQKPFGIYQLVVHSDPPCCMRIHHAKV